MDRNFTWGTDIEILTMAHLLNTRVFVYNTVHENWGVYSPHNVDRSLNEPDITHMSMLSISVSWMYSSILVYLKSR